MPSVATFFTVLAGILALIAGAIYVFGIPREWKRAAEEKALETMGENKASYMLKGKLIFSSFPSITRFLLTILCRPDQ